MKRIVSVVLGIAVLSGSYVLAAYDAKEPITKNTPSISELNAYVPKELNDRQKDLVDIGRFTAAGDQEALRETIASAIERGTLTPTEISIAIRQLYAAAGLKQMKAALATFEQLREERPEFGVDYDKFIPKRIGLSRLFSDGNSSAVVTTGKSEDSQEVVKYNTFRIKKPKPRNRNHSRLDKLDKQLVEAAAVGTRSGNTNVVFDSSKKSLAELGLNPQQIKYLENMLNN